MKADEVVTSRAHSNVDLGLTVTVCGCGNRQTRTLEFVVRTHGGFDENGKLKPCPNPIKIVDLGSTKFWPARHPVLFALNLIRKIENALRKNR